MSKPLKYSKSFSPGSEGMILSLFSICPASMGNISFSDFCGQVIKHEAAFYLARFMVNVLIKDVKDLTWKVWISGYVL